MKSAKRYPFLALQQQRFTLHFSNQSSAAHTPAERDFYRWAWQALKNEYRRAQISIILLDDVENIILRGLKFLDVWVISGKPDAPVITDEYGNDWRDITR